MDWSEFFKNNKAAVWFTVVWLLIAGLVGYNKDVFGQKPNEIGDFFAGVFSALAFFWFILSYYQQGLEIKQNTQALNSQREEFETQSKAMRDQAEALKSAADSLLEYAQPFITTHFEIRGASDRILLIVQNVGIRPAYNVRFRFDPPLTERAYYKKMDYQKFMELDMMPPGYRNEFLYSTRTICFANQEDINWRFNVGVTYGDASGVQHNRTYPMSFFDSFNKLYSATKEPDESLDAIAKGVSDLNRSTQKIRDAIQSLEAQMNPKKTTGVPTGK